MSVFGTRPEAIKMAPVVLELCKFPDAIESIVAVTAQHREMLDQVLNLFNIRPDFDLNIMSEEQTLFDITSRALLGLDKVLTAAKPDVVLVHGDTTTTFAGALAAYYHQIEVGHVEAGLRTLNKFSPYPEEMNRRLTGALADLNFAPTATAKQNVSSRATRSLTRFIKLSAQILISRINYRTSISANGLFSSRRIAAKIWANQCATFTRL